ncbi:Tes-like protein [Mus musculus]|uniref:Testin n=2 Tax=Mus TaxID=862507 RepID=B1AXB9_MOUSE|nr:Tes-like protein [Mus musculus]NP_001405305.1 Tes-like protein [Mus musculus]AAI47619.1 Predicted gene, EG236749 [Mus musculus]AAI47628.1 Predicted gene, EG236749 [Mus musculus]|eukprot:NP_001030036.2 Tes-like protein [Mus musculus]
MMGLGHEQGIGAPCRKCKENCEGFELHFWRKTCRNCKCGQEEHGVLLSTERDRKVGRLFEDAKYINLIAKLKSEAIPTHKPNVMVLRNPVPAKKNDAINTVTYDWIPSVQNKALARQYMQMLPKEKQPVTGSEGAQYRKKQLAKQLPAHDQDPSKCHGLSYNEIKKMKQFVEKYKSEALGVGNVKRPSDMNAQGDKVHNPAGIRNSTAVVGSKDKSKESKKTQYTCYCCKHPMKEGDPAIYAERAGYSKLWHPACFICSICGEILVDMIYFWKNGKLYCGRHYCDSEKPRCSGCDELIFSNEYTQAENKNWHLKHFCCIDCHNILAGKIYVMLKSKPVCKPCYMKNHAVVCQGCHNAIDPEEQRVIYKIFSWHASTACFLCSCCSKCLIGEKFIPVEGMVFCSTQCKNMMY